MNAAYPIEVTLFGIVTEVKLVQYLNNEVSITERLVGILTVVKLIQLSKQFLPIEVILSERFIDSNPVQ